MFGCVVWFSLSEFIGRHFCAALIVQRYSYSILTHKVSHHTYRTINAKHTQIISFVISIFNQRRWSEINAFINFSIFTCNQIIQPEICIPFPVYYLNFTHAFVLRKMNASIAKTARTVWIVVLNCTKRQ